MTRSWEGAGSAGRRNPFTSPRTRWWAVPLLLLLVALVYLFARYQGPVRELMDAKSRLNTANKELSRIAKGKADSSRITYVQQQLVEARRELGAPTDQIDDGFEMRLLKHVPGIRGQVQALETMREAARSGADLGIAAMPILQSALEQPKGSDPLAGLLKGLQSRPTFITDARADLSRLQRSLDRLKRQSLIWPLSGQRDNAVRNGAKIAADGPKLIDTVAAVQRSLGSGTHHYLVILGNPAEERPGGGFMGVIGLVTSKDGRIVDKQFRDSYFRPSRVLDRKAPGALDRHLFVGRPYEFPDTNWRADFHDAASDVADFYKAETGTQVDGVISLDVQMISKILGIIGPIRPAGYRQQIYAKNTLRDLNLIANKVRPGDPGKPYVVAFGHELLDRITNLRGAQLARVAKVLSAGVGDRDLVMAFRDPQTQAIVATHHAGGLIGVEKGSDQLLVTDANLSGGKNDLFVQRSSALTVTVKGDVATHHLTLRYRQPVAKSAEDRGLQPGSGGAYRDYLQLFLPAGGVLTDMKGGGPEEVGTYHGRPYLGVFVIVGQGQAVQLDVTYTSPAQDRVVLQRQSQALAHPTVVSVTWGDGHRSTRTTATARDLALTGD